MIWPDIITNKIYWYLWKVNIANVNKEYTLKFMLYQDYCSAYGSIYKDSVVVMIQHRNIINSRKLPVDILYNQYIYKFGSVESSVPLPKNY